MKIAIYSGEIPSTVFIERLIIGLADKDYQIILFGYVKNKVEYPKNVRIVGFTNKWQKLTVLFYYTLLLSIFKRIDKKRLDSIINKRVRSNKEKLKTRLKYYPVLWHAPDIFHLQWAKSINDWQWVQLFGIKLVLSLRGAHINYSPITDTQLAQTYRKYFPTLEQFHAVSKAIGKEAEKYGAQKEKIQVIYSGLDMENLKFELPENENFFQGKKVYIVSVGRPHWKKGYPYALRAFKILKERKFSFTYTIIGGVGSEEILYLKKLIGFSKDELKILDKTSIENVLEVMRRSDLLLLPSLEEGIANVVLEAMALGTPVLTTSCGGMNEIVEDGVNGWIVPIRDPNAIANKIMNIQKLSPEVVSSITKKAREKIEEQHNIYHMVHDMKKLYNNVMKLH